jgi:hypothetical protein
MASVTPRAILALCCEAIAEARGVVKDAAAVYFLGAAAAQNYG